MVLETGTPLEIQFFFWMTIITHDGYQHPAVMFLFQDEKEGCAFLLAIFFHPFTMTITWNGMSVPRFPVKFEVNTKNTAKVLQIFPAMAWKTVKALYKYIFRHLRCTLPETNSKFAP